MRWIALSCMGLGLIGTGRAASPGTPIIPQDRDRMEARAREMIAWNRATLGAAYEAVGSREDHWDRAAKGALEAAAAHFGKRVDPFVESSEVFERAKEAVDLGCNDPMILYLYGRMAVGRNFPGVSEHDRRMTAAARALDASRYPSYRVAAATIHSAAERVGRRDLTPGDREALAASVEAAVALVTKATEAERTVDWDLGWQALLTSATDTLRKTGKLPRVALEVVATPMKGVPGLEILLNRFRGAGLILLAEEARAGRPIARLPAEERKQVEPMIKEARAVLTLAWKLRPDGLTARLLLQLESADGADRPVVDRWFRRAMAADGDDQRACVAMLDWLDPKAHGSTDEMVAFGEACRSTRNWRAGITLLAADAHRRAAIAMPPAEGRAYLGEAEVWSAITEVYDEYLAHYPRRNLERSLYAGLCYQAGKFDEANAQFEMLGEGLVGDSIFTIDRLKFMKAEAAKVIAKRGDGERPR